MMDRSTRGSCFCDVVPAALAGLQGLTFACLYSAVFQTHNTVLTSECVHTEEADKHIGRYTKLTLHTLNQHNTGAVAERL